jgi:hypothetical protein
MKINLFASLVIGLFVTLALAQNNETEANVVDDGDDGLSENLRSKLRRAPSGKAIAGDYIVVYNQSRVREVVDSCNELQQDGIDLEMAYLTLRRTKIRISGEEGFGFGATAERRRQYVLRR